MGFMDVKVNFRVIETTPVQFIGSKKTVQNIKKGTLYV